MQIELLDYLSEANILLDVKGKSKKTVLSHLLDHLISLGKCSKNDKKEIVKVLLQREEMGSTAIGGGIALPHARLGCVDNIVLCVGISREGLDFESLDGEPIYILVLLLSNHKEAGLHLKMLALLARILRDKYFVQRIRHVQTREEIFLLIEKQQALVR
jgi:mannitol/fructose-specific phosphotransferase system IIA component (Ntr-type)